MPIISNNRVNSDSRAPIELLQSGLQSMRPDKPGLGVWSMRMTCSCLQYNTKAAGLYSEILAEHCTRVRECGREIIEIDASY